MGGGRLRGDATGAERVWGGCLFVPAGELNNNKIENKRGGAQALGGRQSIKNATINRTTVSGSLQVNPGWAGHPDGFLQVNPGWAG